MKRSSGPRKTANLPSPTFPSSEDHLDLFGFQFVFDLRYARAETSMSLRRNVYIPQGGYLPRNSCDDLVVCRV